MKNFWRPQNTRKFPEKAHFGQKMTKFYYGGIEFVRNAVRASENSPTKTRETEEISLCGDAIGHRPH